MNRPALTLLGPFQATNGASEETFRSFVRNSDPSWKLLGSTAALIFGLACLKWSWKNDELIYNTYGNYKSQFGLALLGRAGTRLLYFLIGLALVLGAIAVHFA